MMILFGFWLVIRKMVQIPGLSITTLIGVMLLYIAFLVIGHWTASPEIGEPAHLIGEQGGGTGTIGAWLMSGFRGSMGDPGSVIVLISFILLGLAFTLNTTVFELFSWMAPIAQKIGGLVSAVWQKLMERRKKKLTQSLGPAVAHTQQGELMPLTENEAEAVLQAEEDTDEPSFGLEADIPIEYVLPDINEMLDEQFQEVADESVDEARAKTIEETLASFGAPATVVEINRGPKITQFGVEPDYIQSRSGRTRVRVNKIASLSDDLALALAASRIRIQAPVPGKGYVGIEVPNENFNNVSMKEVILSPAFQRLDSPLRFALGQDVAGNAVATDLEGMPHVLIAGATGSGKSVCVNALISCFLLNNTPDDLRFIMIDPKRVELTGYNGIPHLLAPVVTDVEKVVGVLQWVTREMDGRYQKFSDVGARNITDFNGSIDQHGQKKLPYLVVVIDELADLMMVASVQTEQLIIRMAQLARATGIHLVISTQRPSVDVVTGLIKANIPARIAFMTASGTDSKVILDGPGAEKLLGSGDMLFHPPDAPAPVRLQGVWLSDVEINRIVNYWRQFAGTASKTPVVNKMVPDAPPSNIPLKQQEIWEDMQEEEVEDPLYEEAVALVRRQGRASISMLQRRMRIGYTRSARLIENMEQRGIISPPEGPAHNREILDYGGIGPPADMD